MATPIIDQNGVPVRGREIVLSADGTKVTFVGYGPDLVPGDSNGVFDIFVQDVATGAITRVSTDPSGGEANGASLHPVFSPDGTKVAFISGATNLVADDTNRTVDFFVKDLVTGSVQRVGTGAGYVTDFNAPRIVFSPDGTKVAFVSQATDLVAGDTNNHDDVFVTDLSTGAVTRISTAQDGTEANGDSREVVFSPDGTKVAFSSAASNLVAGDTNGFNDIFVKDLATGEIECIASPWGAFWPAFSPDGSVTLQGFQRPAFSSDGTKSAFWSGFNIFVKDWVTGSVMAVFPGNTSGVYPTSPDLSWAGDTLAYSTLDGLFLQRLSFVSIAPLDSVKSEGDAGYTDFTFTVTRNGDLSQAQTVKWSIDNPYNGVAPYFGGTVPSGVVNFAAGESSKLLVVKVPGDTVVEPYPQLFHLTLAHPSDGLLVDVGSADGQILNDDMRIHDDAYFVSPGQTLHVPAATWGALPPLYEIPAWLLSGTVTLDDTRTHLLSGGVLANDELLTSLGTASVTNATATTLGLIGGFITTPSPPVWTASLVEGPAHGTLSFGADGHFDYTPDAGFFGIDQFTYNASGPLGQADGHAMIYVVPEIRGEITTLNLLALSAEQQVAATYLAFFGRGADADGFKFWVDQFHAAQATQGPAMLFANIASSFGVSGEAAQQYSFLAHPQTASDTEIGWFLNQVYFNLFTRPIDDAGKAYWTDQVRQKMTGGEFVGSVLVDIMSGAQNPPQSEGPHDALRLLGRVAVSLAYVHQQEVFGTSWTAENLVDARNILQGVAETPGTVLTGIANAENAVLAHVFGH